MHALASWRRPFRSPLFALTVIVLVAAVVAVNATAFSAIHALRWKALPYPEADRLVHLKADLSKFGFTVGLTDRLRRAVPGDGAQITDALGYTVGQQLRQDDSGQRWRIARVSDGFGEVLGVAPAIGRLFAADEMVEGRDDAVVISHAAWQSRFSGDAEVVGRKLRIGDDTYTVVGVMPEGFVFPTASVDAWRPYAMTAREREQSEAGNVGSLDVVARLAPGVSPEQARDRLQAVFLSDGSAKGLLENAGLKAEVEPIRDAFAASHWRALALLQLAAIVLLVVVAANLVNLNLDRLLARSREFQIRRAIGADTRAITRGIAADLMPPIVAGLALGLVLTPFGLGLASRHGLMPTDLPQGTGFGIAAIVAGVVVAVVALASGTLAALLSQRAAALSSRGSASGLGRVRPAMIIAQVMLTTALLGGAGLLLRSAANLMATERGFDATGVVLTAVDPVGVSISGRAFDPAVDGPRYTPFVETLRADVAALPGVRAVAIASAPPFSQWEMVSNMRPTGTDDNVQARARKVGPGFFNALGVGLVAGREFERSDPATGGPVIVDELWARRHLAGRDPLTASVDVPTGGETTRTAPIVGVVRSVKHERLDEAENLPTVYEVADAPLPVFWLVTRVDGDAAAFTEVVRQRVLALAPQADIGVNRALADLVASSIASQRALLGALATFAGVTLLLAALGLAAVLSFAIRRRTAELGVRMAVGATPSRVRNLVLGQGGRLIVSGALLGLAVGVPLARVLGDRLYGVAFTDPLTWLAAAAVVAGVALVACWWPAHRAAATDPVVALRSE